MLLATFKVEIQGKVTEACRQTGFDEILDHRDLIGHEKRIAGQYSEVRVNDADQTVTSEPMQPELRTQAALVAARYL